MTKIAIYKNFGKQLYIRFIMYNVVDKTWRHLTPSQKVFSQYVVK